MESSFPSGRFRFYVDFSETERDQERGFSVYLDDDDFALRLTRSGTLPDLNGAPVASWILARLARLTEDRLGLAEEEHVDGGGYMIEFVVYRIPTGPDPQQLLMFGLEQSDLSIEDLPVAAFQFQADMTGAGVIGQRVPDCPAEEILEAFAAELLAAPTDLTPRELAVYDPEWEDDPGEYIPVPDEDTRNWYGWDGSQFLGQFNVRDVIQDADRQ
jgi:hypothetical protein